MANGGLRGLQVMTNTGHEVSTAYYHDNDDTLPDQPIQYAWTEGTSQTKLGPGTATPGYAAPEQVPGGLVATPADTTAPSIEDLTGSEDAPEHRRPRGRAGGHRRAPGAHRRADDRDRPGRPDDPLPAVRGRRTATPRGACRRPLRQAVGGVHRDLRPTARTAARWARCACSWAPRSPTRCASTSRRTSTSAAPRAWPRPPPATRPTCRCWSTARPSPPRSRPWRPSRSSRSRRPAPTRLFRNGVRAGDEVLTIFDEGFYDRVETVTAEVPLRMVRRGEQVTVGIYAGTKAWPEPDPDENNDDFSGAQHAPGPARRSRAAPRQLRRCRRGPGGAPARAPRPHGPDRLLRRHAGLHRRHVRRAGRRVRLHRPRLGHQRRRGR